MREKQQDKQVTSFLRGLTQHEVLNGNGVAQFIDEGCVARKELNRALRTESDRVHSVTSLTVKGTDNVAKITFVCLAGSD